MYKISTSKHVCTAKYDGHETHDMKWDDVDAVKLFEECTAMEQNGVVTAKKADAVDADRDDYAFTHYSHGEAESWGAFC